MAYLISYSTSGDPEAEQDGDDKVSMSTEKVAASSNELNVTLSGLEPEHIYTIHIKSLSEYNVTSECVVLMAHTGARQLTSAQLAVIVIAAVFLLVLMAVGLFALARYYRQMIYKIRSWYTVHISPPVTPVSSTRVYLNDDSFVPQDIGLSDSHFHALPITCTLSTLHDELVEMSIDSGSFSRHTGWSLQNASVTCKAVKDGTARSSLLTSHSADDLHYSRVKTTASLPSTNINSRRRCIDDATPLSLQQQPPPFGRILPATDSQPRLLMLPSSNSVTDSLVDSDEDERVREDHESISKPLLSEGYARGQVQDVTFASVPAGVAFPVCCEDSTSADVPAGCGSFCPNPQNQILLSASSVDVVADIAGAETDRNRTRKLSGRLLPAISTSELASLEVADAVIGNFGAIAVIAAPLSDEAWNSRYSSCSSDRDMNMGTKAIS
jgi:hypothetical protein